MINNLIKFFKKELSEQHSKQMLKNLIPKIVKLAIDLPNKIRLAIPILKAGLESY